MLRFWLNGESNGEAALLQYTEMPAKRFYVAAGIP
jgi:hypothetical protein